MKKISTAKLRNNYPAANSKLLPIGVYLQKLKFKVATRVRNSTIKISLRGLGPPYFLREESGGHTDSNIALMYLCERGKRSAIAHAAYTCLILLENKEKVKRERRENKIMDIKLGDRIVGILAFGMGPVFNDKAFQIFSTAKQLYGQSGDINPD